MVDEDEILRFAQDDTPGNLLALPACGRKGQPCRPEHIRFTQCKLREGSAQRSISLPIEPDPSLRSG